MGLNVKGERIALRRQWDNAAIGAATPGAMNKYYIGAANYGTMAKYCDWRTEFHGAIGQILYWRGQLWRNWPNIILARPIMAQLAKYCIGAMIVAAGRNL